MNHPSEYRLNRPHLPSMNLCDATPPNTTPPNTTAPNLARRNRCGWSVVLLAVGLLSATGCTGTKPFLHNRVCDGECGEPAEMAANSSGGFPDSHTDSQNGTAENAANVETPNETGEVRYAAHENIYPISDPAVQNAYPQNAYPQYANAQHPAAGSPYSQGIQPTPDTLPPGGYPGLPNPSQDPWGIRQVHLPPYTPQSAALVCEAHLNAMRQEFAEKQNALEMEISTERGVRKSMEQSLASVTQELARLSQELGFFREEVRRLDEATELQHRSDMASMERLTSLIGELSESSLPEHRGPTNALAAPMTDSP